MPYCATTPSVCAGNRPAIRASGQALPDYHDLGAVGTYGLGLLSKPPPPGSPAVTVTVGLPL